MRRLIGYDFRDGHVTQVGGDEKYKKRNIKELDRREAATDSEFWLAVCFVDRDACERFKDMVGLEGKCVSGERARKFLPKPSAQKRQFQKVVGGVPTPHTDGALDAVEYTGDFQTDSVSETLAIFAYIGLGDEVPYVPIWFRDRADKDDFVSEYNLAGHGDKYVYGDAWMEELEARDGGSALWR